MDRVVVVGPPGSGKTTLGRALAAALGCEHVELDGLWWGPGWTEAGDERFRARMAAAVAGDRWVLDGNYVSKGACEVAWPRADTVVWLDQPRWVTVPRVVRRTAVRAVRGVELWAGNRESLRSALGPESIVRFAWIEHPKYRARYAALGDAPEHAHLLWVRLRGQRAVDRWLATVA